MNPSQPTSSPLPEQQPQPTVQPEVAGHPIAEQAPAPAPMEMAPQPSVAPSAATVSAPQADPLATTQPAIPPMAPVPPAAGAPAAPVIADDVDVIEKEWVDHATEIIEATSQDPYVEEEAIEDLQVDYLKKRYGKEIKKAESDQPQTPTPPA